MDKLVLNDINLLDVGITIGMIGAVYTDENHTYLCLLPEYQDLNGRKMVSLEMPLTDWEKFIRQTDLMETEVLAQAENGKLTKILLRKTARQIDQWVSWKVFQRDSYTCRYCGKTGIPLTVDHLVLWENGGPSIEANLVTACKKCNKTRGSMEYKDWLESPQYKKVSTNLPAFIHKWNLELIPSLNKIPIRLHQKSR